jgi:diguanylate cyclase (GGDEF)-like protein
MKMSDLFEFSEDPRKSDEPSSKTWKVLVVDDEVSIHDVTISALKSVMVEGRRLEIISAMNATEAKQKLDEHDDIALALIDVVMETRTAGLELVDYIRQELGNHLMRLVVRTGQPDEVPERYIIDRYDINDYKEKTELTVDKLYTVIRSSIKQHMQLVELESKYEDVYKQMTTHPLSRLPNRLKLNEILDSEGPKHLVLINIDGFSMINETQGFEIGDELLVQMGSCLQGLYGDEMEVFHLESDTFAILCTTECIDEDKLFAIQTEVNRMTFLLGGIENRLSVTMGVVVYEVGNLIQKAELALKEARKLGRNRVGKYSKDIGIIQTIHHNSIWTKRVREALEKGWILTYYQPIFSIETGEIMKYETLVRMAYEGEIISPFQFLQAAKNSGQLYDIFKIMFRNACKKTKEFSGQFTVNVTDQDLQEPTLVEFIQQTISEFEVDPRQLGIEILEEKSIMNNELIKQRLFALTEMGISIIIDDFGAECSNFGQIVNLPISVLKIDGTFIKDLPENPKHRIITEAIAEFAKKMNLSVVAEFVHSEEVMEIVSKMGITYAQGFYLAEPSVDIINY